MKEGLDLAELPCINCAAGKYKAAADVNIACNQCEAAPRGIAFQRFLDQYDNCLQPGTGRDTETSDQQLKNFGKRHEYFR